MADAKPALQQEQGVEGGCWIIWLCNLFRWCIQITASYSPLQISVNMLKFESYHRLFLQLALVKSFFSLFYRHELLQNSFPVFHPRLCQLPKPWSHQRSPLLKLPTLCFTPSSFPAPAGSNVSSTSDYRILPQTNLFVLKETALYLHILSFFYNSHAAKDFSINSERQLRFFLRSLSLKLSFTVMFTKKVSLD